MPMNDTSINVLLIEDDSGDAYLLQALLSSAEPVNFHLVCADRLATGLDHLSRNDFDIILLDLSLPDSRGLCTIDKVRLHMPNVPIVVLTGLDDEDTAMQAVQAGAQDYLSKDHLDHNMLTRSIRYAVERHRLQLALDQARLQEENSLKQAYDELETRVEARTAELKRANAHLQAEIAERKKAENEREALVAHLMAANRALEELTGKVQQSHRENEQLIAAISSILIGVEADGRISQWNAKAAMTFGLSRSEVLGCLLPECGLPWNEATVLAGVKRCRQSQQAVQLDHVHFTRDDKTEGFLNLILSPVERGVHGQFGILILGQDITHRLLLENQLAQARKLEAIGQLAAGIAHEINTPTQYVSDNTRFLQDAFQDLYSLWSQYDRVCQAAIDHTLEESDLLKTVEQTAMEIDVPYLYEEIPTAIQQSLEGLERVATIVRAMKEFSHPGGEEKAAINLNKAIESTITVARNEWKYVAEMVTDFDLNLPVVLCLAGDINQVILNLVVNAAHAISEVVKEGDGPKGTITISTRHVPPWAEIHVQDTGPGIPEDIRERIFNPFFTTKGIGVGTGQGLAITHTVVVEKHGGTITLDTEVGHGTTFIIRLPIETSDLLVT